MKKHTHYGLLWKNEWVSNDFNLQFLVWKHKNNQPHNTLDYKTKRHISCWLLPKMVEPKKYNVEPTMLKAQTLKPIKFQLKFTIHKSFDKFKFSIKYSGY